MLERIWMYGRKWSGKQKGNWGREHGSNKTDRKWKEGKDMIRATDMISQYK